VVFQSFVYGQNLAVLGSFGQTLIVDESLLEARLKS
jgi:hypothetical protein